MYSSVVGSVGLKLGKPLLKQEQLLQHSQAM